MIIPANKGNATVVIEKSDYDRRMRGMLDDATTYRKLPKDPTAAQEARIGRTLLKLHENKEISKSICHLVSRIYGVPKIQTPP